MFLEYRKELRVIFNNIGALVSCCSVVMTLCYFYSMFYYSH